MYNQPQFHPQRILLNHQIIKQHQLYQHEINPNPNQKDIAIYQLVQQNKQLKRQLSQFLKNQKMQSNQNTFQYINSNRTSFRNSIDNHFVQKGDFCQFKQNIINRNIPINQQSQTLIMENSYKDKIFKLKAKKSPQSKRSVQKLNNNQSFGYYNAKNNTNQQSFDKINKVNESFNKNPNLILKTNNLCKKKSTPKMVSCEYNLIQNQQDQNQNNTLLQKVSKQNIRFTTNSHSNMVTNNQIKKTLHKNVPNRFVQKVVQVNKEQKTQLSQQYVNNFSKNIQFIKVLRQSKQKNNKIIKQSQKLNTQQKNMVHRQSIHKKPESQKSVQMQKKHFPKFYQKNNDFKPEPQFSVKCQLTKINSTQKIVNQQAKTIKQQQAKIPTQKMIPIPQKHENTIKLVNQLSHTLFQNISEQNTKKVSLKQLRGNIYLEDSPKDMKTHRLSKTHKNSQQKVNVVLQVPTSHKPLIKQSNKYYMDLQNTQQIQIPSTLSIEKDISQKIQIQMIKSKLNNSQNNNHNNLNKNPNTNQNTYQNSNQNSNQNAKQVSSQSNNTNIKQSVKIKKSFQRHSRNVSDGIHIESRKLYNQVYCTDD